MQAAAASAARTRASSLIRRSAGQTDRRRDARRTTERQGERAARPSYRAWPVPESSDLLFVMSSGSAGQRLTADGCDDLTAVIGRESVRGQEHVRRSDLVRVSSSSYGHLAP